MKYNAQDRKLNILDMLFAIALKWRSIIVMALVFACLAAGYSYYGSIKSAEALNNARKESIDLSESNELMILRYAELYELYLSHDKYCSESLYMSLDANKYYEGRVQYYITIDSENDETVQNAIISAYEQRLSSEEFYKKVETIVGDSTAHSYYSELIDCNKNLESIVYGADSYESMEYADGMLVVSVRQNDEDLCRELLDIVVEEIKNIEGKIKNQIKDHSLVELNNSVCEKSNNMILSLQKSQRDKVTNYNAALATLENQLTDAEVAYAKTLVDDMDTTIAQEQEITIEMTQYKPSVSKKLTVLGFLAGGFLGVVIYAFLYLMGSCLRINDDFFEAQGIRVFGYLRDKSTEKKRVFGFIDKWILSLRYRMVPEKQYDDTIALIVTNIAIICKKEKRDMITITRSDDSKGEKKVLSELAKGLEKRNIQVTEGKTISDDLQALENASESEMLVVIETVNKTSCYLAQTEIEMSKEHGIRLLGVVMLID